MREITVYGIKILSAECEKAIQLHIYYFLSEAVQPTKQILKLIHDLSLRCTDEATRQANKECSDILFFASFILDFSLLYNFCLL